MKQKILFLVSFMLMFTFGINAQNAWINEIHYDNVNTDEGEAVEIVIENPSSYILSDFQVVLYNGNNGTNYSPATADSFTEGNTEGNFTFYVYYPTSIQNGAPDGLCLSYQGNVIQFLSYEGSFAATDGVASGLTSTDIGVSETSATPIGYSLQLSGAGTGYADFAWQVPATATPGLINNNQSFGGTTNDQTSTVTAGADIPAANISSIATDSIPVLQFTITDAGGDALPTIVTGINFVAGPNNTISFQDNLGGGALYDKTNSIQIPFAGAPVVDATSAYLPINLSVPEGGSINLEVALYIDNANVPDGAIAQFQINSDNHGFTADASGSDFEDPFTGGDIVGNDFTYEVVATQLSFTQQPTNVVTGAIMTPAVEVAATDIFGNVDVDQNSNVTLTFLGTGTMSGTNPVMSVEGVATFSDLSFDTEENSVTIRANIGPSPEVTSIPFNVVGLPVATLPYIEPFLADLGDLYTYSVLGASSEWFFDIDKARVNGYGSGETQEDWLILPNINLDNYLNEVMTFETQYSYGTNDADNYLKLMYSNDYAGTGDPTSATWIELTYNQPSASATFTSSGNIDLSAINGTNIYLAFKYHGTDGNYRRWDVDNINIFEQVTIPVISGIGHTPTNPTPADIVTVAATIIDDIAVTAANVYWSLTSPVTIADNSLTMIEGASNIFETETGIPAQVATTTVYYMIGAFDASKGEVFSPEQSYTVSTPTGGGADCANALSIVEGTHFAVHTQVGDGSIYDQWYSFVAPYSGTATVENCASEVDMYILIQEGTCGNDYDMADDDVCGNDLDPLSENFTFNITAGETYFIGLGNYDQALTPNFYWSLSFSDVIPVNSIALLRTGAIGGQKYELTSEAILTYQQSYRNQKFVQDATAGILIDDQAGTITTVYNQYDGISGLTGTLSEYNGMLQFVPNADPGVASSTGNTVAPQVITLAQFNSNFEDYEAELVTIQDATFTDAGGTFANGTLYEVTDASTKSAANFRTNFYNVDYIAGVIPTNANITALCVEHSSGITFTARDLADIDVIIGLNEINANSILVYPNPSNGMFTINVKDKYNVEVLDIAGKTLNTKTINSSTTISISDAGVYFLRFSNENGTFVKRVIVQ